MFSLESICNHHIITNHKTTFPGERYKTKVFHTPTGTKDNSINKCTLKRDITGFHISIQHLLMKTINLSGFIFCSVSYELRLQLHRLSLVDSKCGAEYNLLSGFIGENVMVCLFL